MYQDSVTPPFIEKLDSKAIKTALARFYRFRKGMGIALEFAYDTKDIEDLIAYNAKEVVCIEIKTSVADLMADFRNKEKHKESYEPYFDKFFFAIPKELKDKTLEFLSKKNKESLNRYRHYGVIAINNNLEIQIVKESNSDIRAKEHKARIGYPNMNGGSLFHKLVLNSSKELTKEMSRSVIFLRKDGYEKS